MYMCVNVSHIERSEGVPTVVAMYVRGRSVDLLIDTQWAGIHNYYVRHKFHPKIDDKKTSNNG